eukprot:1161382-Pelagomonas_calceolata.AAC.1
MNLLTTSLAHVSYLVSLRQRQRCNEPIGTHACKLPLVSLKSSSSSSLMHLKLIGRIALKFSFTVPWSPTHNTYTQVAAHPVPAPGPGLPQPHSPCQPRAARGLPARCAGALFARLGGPPPAPPHTNCPDQGMLPSSSLLSPPFSLVHPARSCLRSSITSYSNWLDFIDACVHPGGAPSGASLGDGHGGAGAPLRCLGPGPRPEYDPHTARPTLMLVRDMAEQARRCRAGKLWRVQWRLRQNRAGKCAWEGHGSALKMDKAARTVESRQASVGKG